MLYIAIFFLVFYTPWFSECSFIPKSLPIHPKLEEDVLLACKLTAPDGYQFSGTVPDLTTSNIDHQFDFDEIQSKFGDSRYHGWSIRDSSSTYLQGFIFIFSLNESDFFINFTCSQYVENDRIISASLILNNFIQNTPTSSTQTHAKPTTVSSTNDGNASITDSPSIGTTGSIYNTPIHPTVTTSKEVSESSDCSYLLAIIGILSAVLCICSVFVFTQCITLWVYIYFFWKKQDKNRCSNQTTTTNTDPMRPLHLSNNAPSSESSTSSSSFKSCTSQLSNRECPKLQNDCSTEESYHTRKILNSESGSEENL